MQRKRHDSRRVHTGEPASHSTACAVFEMLESRQLMSVAAPTVEPTGAMLAADPASYAPLAAPATPAATAATDATAADAASVTAVAPEDGGEQPPPTTGGDDTAEARSFWDRVKGAAKWVKNHVTATLHSIGIKGTF